jgi:Protein of unknown function (DUF1569)
MDRYLTRLHEALLSATRGMTPETLMRHPEGKWSAADVLEHLYLTYKNTGKGFVRCLQAGKPLASSPTFRQRLRTMLVAELGYFPQGRNSPDGVRPRGTATETIRSEILRQLETMDQVIGEAEVRYGSSVRLLDHPILGPLTGKQWRKFHWVHGRHHVKQIERLKQRVS